MLSWGKLSDALTDAEGETTEHYSLTRVQGYLQVCALSPRARTALEAVSEDDPVIVFCWNYPNLRAAVAVLNGAYAAGAAVPAAWIGGVFPIDEERLMMRILQRVGTFGGGILGNALVAPNSLVQFARVREQMVSLSFDPLLQSLPGPVFPLANIYTVSGGTLPNLTAVAMPVSAPPAPGVHVLA